MSWSQWLNANERAIQRENGAKIEAQDRVRALEAELAVVRAELAQSRRETVESVQHVADWMSQQMFGRKIYGSTPELPASNQEPGIVRQRIQGRALVNQLEREFFEQFEPIQ